MLTAVLSGYASATPDEGSRLTWAAYGPRNRRVKPRIRSLGSEWTAVGQTEVECVREMARCLREIGNGRVPK